MTIAAYQGVCPTCLHDHGAPHAALASSGDHAELARLAEAAEKVPTDWECDTKEGQAFIAAANPATVLALLAEIAALRAEAVGLLEPFAKLADEEGGYREDDHLAWGLNTADINWGDLRAARNFLSKEAERG